MMKYIFILYIIVFNIDLQAQTFSFFRTSPPIIYTNDTSGVISEGVVNNLTNDSMDLRLIRSNVNMPQGWETCMCDILQCRPTGTDTAAAKYPPGQSTIYVMLWAHSIPGTGFVTFRAERVSNPGENYTVIFGGAYNPIGIQQISTIANQFNLSQNYPNPFNPNTRIKFQIPKPNFTKLTVFDILGNEVKTLVSDNLRGGEYEVDFDASELASGIYYYTLKAGEYISVKKMVLIK
jgi:hypothetical protein